MFKFPENITNNKEKLKYLYRIAELLRLEHNTNGQLFRKNKFKDFRNYQRNDFEPRLQNVLFERNKILEAEGVTKMIDIEHPTEKQKEFQELKRTGKLEVKWDKNIDIKTIKKAGRGIKISDPVENFEDYTEVDPNSRITVTATRCTFTALTPAEEAWVYLDKGVDHFDGDFEHLLTVKETAHNVTNNYVTVGVWGLANTIASVWDIASASGSCLAVWHYNNIGNDYRLYLVEIYEGVFAGDAYGDAVEGTVYYTKIKRDEAVGTYGTLYQYIYSDAARTNLLDTTSIALHTSKKDYRYIYGIQASDRDGTVSLSGYCENLDLQEIPPSPNLNDRNNYNGYVAFIQQYIKHKINGTTPWLNPYSAP